MPHTSRYLLIACTLVLHLCWPLVTSSAETGPSDDGPPHVVLIMVDDMGYGDPQFNNPASKIRTPHLNKLAGGGLRFTDAHAPGPLCHLSRYGLMTGRYPFRAQVQLWPNQPVINKDQATVSSMLRGKGYETAMVGKWHLGFAENGYDQPLPGGPVDVGFGSFFGIRASTDIPPYFYIRDRQAVLPPTVPISANYSEGWSPIQGKFWREGLIAPNMQLADVLPRFTQEAIAVVERYADRQRSSTGTDGQADSPAADSPVADGTHSDSPLFLYLAYPAPHTPWLPSAEFAGKSRVGLYGDFVEMVDAEIGRVLEALDKAGMSKDTLVIFTSDNGPVWYEEDVARFDHDACGGLRGMKADAWEAGHRMPFVVRWPGRVEAGGESSQLISFTDLFATLASIVNHTLQPNEAPDSFDFSPVLLSNSDPARAAGLRTSLPLQSGGGLMTFRHGSWKLIDGLGSGGFSKPRRIAPSAGEAPVQLYDLSNDPSENHNAATAEAERAARMRSEMQAIVRAKGHREVL